MRIIVSDTSCMIDLRKAALLQDTLRLPYTFVMPDTLFEDEWLCLDAVEKQALRASGLEVRELPGPSVQRAAQVFNRHRRLKMNDCFALALAESLAGSILLSGDGLLRRVAQDLGVEVRGVLWITDELETHNILPATRLHEVLKLFQDDDLVFLPKDEILKRVKRLAKIL